MLELHYSVDLNELNDDDDDDDLLPDCTTGRDTVTQTS